MGSPVIRASVGHVNCSGMRGHKPCNPPRTVVPLPIQMLPLPEPCVQALAEYRLMVERWRQMQAKPGMRMILYSPLAAGSRWIRETSIAG
jgi:hypothetical protein